MIEQMVVVKNHGGIHARPAGIIVKTAQSYQSDIDFIYNKTTINVKNIMALIAVNISHNNKLKIACNGIDEKEAAHAFKLLFANRFGED